MNKKTKAGNVYDELGFKDAGTMLLKAKLVVKIAA